MIERSYGWGIGLVLMPRRHVGPPAELPRRGSGADIIGHLVHDIPWRILSGSVSVAVVALIFSALLHPHIPTLNRPDAAPIAVAVRFLETPAPSPPELREKKIPAAVQPEKPRPIPQPETVPEPSLPAATLASDPPDLPRLQVTKAATPPPLVETTPPVGKEIDLGPLPDLSPPSDRAARDAIPKPGDLALRRTAGFDPPLSESGLSRERYAQRREEPRTTAPTGGREINLQRNIAEPGITPAAGLSFQERPTTELQLPSSATRAALHRTDSPHGVPVLTASQVRQAPQSEPPPVAAIATSFEFFDRSTAPELDRTQLISLTELRTCLDPQTETDLRTRLATLLSRPGTCRSGGVFFDFQQPESAWSIRIDIYNFEGTTFRDRCAALQRAVECSEHGRRNTP